MRRVTIPGAGGPQPRLVPEHPPHDLELERQALGAFIIFPDLVEPSHVTPRDFYASANAFVFIAIQALLRDGRPVSTETVRARLYDSNRLELVGGLEYLLHLTDGTITRDVDIARLRHLAKLRDLQQAAMELTLAVRTQHNIPDAVEALERAKQALKEQAEPHPIDAFFAPVGDALRDAPPPRKWLLTRPDDETNGLTTCGFLGLGKVGMLVAAGGAGKTHLVVSLALSVASGRRWLDHYQVSAPGPVLLVLGEEDRDEVWRRLYHTAQSMRMSDAQLERAAQSIVALPLAGVPTLFVDREGNDTELFRRLRARVMAQHWRLIVIDPLSRFAGVDAEKDANGGTRFIQALESLIAPESGAPAVLVAHHTNKLSRDGARASTSNARGTSALTDGARWACELESRGENGARLTLTKSNYGPLAPPLELLRGHDGYLRAEMPEERKRRLDEKDAQEADREAKELEEHMARVLEVLAAHPNLSKAQLATHAGMRDQRVGFVVDRLFADGRLLKSSRYGYSLKPSQDSAQLEVPECS